MGKERSSEINQLQIRESCERHHQFAFFAINRGSVVHEMRLILCKDSVVRVIILNEFKYALYLESLNI